MYSKEESAKIRHQFWISFGQYMNPIPSMTGEKVNWVNYKTGVKEIRIRLNANRQLASVSIEIRGDEERKKTFWKFFQLLKDQFSSDWNWVENSKDENGKLVDKIFVELQPVNLYRKEDWPNMISFLKKYMIFWDEFWAENKDIAVDL